MSIFKREPRAVYQVYDEEEYLAGEESGEADAEDSSIDAWGVASLTDDSRDARLRRIGLLGLLASAMVVVVVLIVVHATHPARTGSRVASAAVLRANHVAPPTVASITRLPVRRASEGERLEAKRSPRGPVRPSPDGPLRDSPRHLLARSPHSAVGRLSRRSPISAAPISAQVESPAFPPPTPPAGAQAEFGFER